MKTTRKDFKQLLQNSKQNDLDNDPFMEDAIEGWKNNSLPFDYTMSRLDGKWKSRSRILFFFISGLSVVVFFVALLFLNSSGNKTVLEESKPLFRLNQPQSNVENENPSTPIPPKRKEEMYNIII